MSDRSNVNAFGCWMATEAFEAFAACQEGNLERQNCYTGVASPSRIHKPVTIGGVGDPSSRPLWWFSVQRHRFARKTGILILILILILLSTQSQLPRILFQPAHQTIYHPSLPTVEYFKSSLYYHLVPSVCKLHHE